MMVQQNKWRAARFGNQAKLVDTNTYQVATCADTVERLVMTLQPTAAELNCESYLNHCITMVSQPSAAQQQLDMLGKASDRRDAVRRLVEASRVSETP